jgi:hypothetical protein
VGAGCDLCRGYWLTAEARPSSAMRSSCRVGSMDGTPAWCRSKWSEGRRDDAVGVLQRRAARARGGRVALAEAARRLLEWGPLAIGTPPVSEGCGYRRRGRVAAKPQPPDAPAPAARKPRRPGRRRSAPTIGPSMPPLTVALWGYAQQVAPQQAVGFDARTKALTTFPWFRSQASTSQPSPTRKVRASATYIDACDLVRPHPGTPRRRACRDTRSRSGRQRCIPPSAPSSGAAGQEARP